MLLFRIFLRSDQTLGLPVAFELNFSLHDEDWLVGWWWFGLAFCSVNRSNRKPNHYSLGEVFLRVCFSDVVWDVKFPFHIFSFTDFMVNFKKFQKDTFLFLLMTQKLLLFLFCLIFPSLVSLQPFHFFTFDILHTVQSRSQRETLGKLIDTVDESRVPSFIVLISFPKLLLILLSVGGELLAKTW